MMKIDSMSDDELHDNLMDSGIAKAVKAARERLFIRAEAQRRNAAYHGESFKEYLTDQRRLIIQFFNAMSQEVRQNVGLAIKESITELLSDPDESDQQPFEIDVVIDTANINVFITPLKLSA